MPTTRRVNPSPKNVQARQQRLKKKRLHSVQIGVPDVQSRAFAAEARRQSLAVAGSPQEAEDQAFVDAISEWNDE